jgi:hypothetical protein
MRDSNSRPSAYKSKNLHISALGGHCPCCGITTIVDEYEIVIEAEFDHFYSRERRYFEDTWLICRACHLDMKNRVEYLPEFQVYQRRARVLDNGQLSLCL